MVNTSGLAAAISAVLLCCSAAHAIECRHDKGTQGHWSWRTVDGQTCWYQGAAGRNRSKLSWRKPSAPSALSKQDEDDVLATGVWPPLPKRK